MLAAQLAPALPTTFELGDMALGIAMMGSLGALIARLFGWLRPQPIPVPIPVRVGPRRPDPRRRR